MTSFYSSRGYGTLLGQAARLVRDAMLKDPEAAPLLRVVASVLDTGEGKPIARQHCSGQLRPLRSTNLACRLAPPNLHGSLRLVLARDASPGSYIISFCVTYLIFVNTTTYLL